MTQEDELIRYISRQASDSGRDLLIEFLNVYKLYGLYQATVNQLQEFITKKGL